MRKTAKIKKNDLTGITQFSYVSSLTTVTAGSINVIANGIVQTISRTTFLTPVSIIPRQTVWKSIKKG